MNTFTKRLRVGSREVRRWRPPRRLDFATQCFGFWRVMIRRFRSHTLLPSPQALQRLVPNRTEEIGPERSARRVEATIRPEQRQEAFLHDVLSVSHRAGKAPRESEERKVVIVEEL